MVTNAVRAQAFSKVACTYLF